MSKQDISNQDSLGTRPAKLRILDKEVKLSCKPGEEEDLLAAAAYIDRSMRDLRSRNHSTSVEKIAIVTAINTANELLKSRSSSSTEETPTHRLRELNKQLAEFLQEPKEPPALTQE